MLAIWICLSSGEGEARAQEGAGKRKEPANRENPSVGMWLTPETGELEGLEEVMAHGRESTDWSYDKQHSTVEKLLT